MSKEALIDDTATVTTESEEFRKQATEADEKIRQSLKNLKRDWVSLGRLCEDFKKKNYHRAIIDEETGKPFTNFGSWAQSVFGKSQSTIFKELRILKELSGKVEDQQLAGIRKENAIHLADLAASGNQLTSEMVEQAATLSEREFVKKISDSTGREAANRFHLRRFTPDTSPETDFLFEEALSAARLRVVGQESKFGINDLAMRDIATVYLASIRFVPKKESESATEEVEMAGIA